MIAALQLLVAPLLGAGFTLWAAWLALAAEADADLPRVLADQLPTDRGKLTTSRALHIAHLALLVLAGAASGSALAWWAAPPVVAIWRLALAVLLVWLVGGILPRFVAVLAPDLPALCDFSP